MPSFARQTGLACEACHTVFPELTPFGRLFKLNGYLFENTKKITDVDKKMKRSLSLSKLPPLSVMVLAANTATNKALPDIGSNANGLPSGLKDQNNTVQFPQQLSLFYAGEVAPNLGAFIQLTYAPDSDSVGIDNTDLRFADNGTFGKTDVIYGISLNNNPTSQDVWNSTPAWGYPYTGPDIAPTPAAAALIDGGLGQEAAGASGYAFIDKAWYVELGGYRTLAHGFQNPITQTAGPLSSMNTNTIDGIAPYMRLAWEHDWAKNSLSFGAYGLRAKLHPGGVDTNGNPTASATSGPVDTYTDAALDTQYQFIGDDNLFSLQATWIHEQRKNGATEASNGTDNLDTMRAIGTYYYHRRYGGSLQLFRTTGTSDSLLYPAALVTGSRTGSPDSDGITAELDYVPWLNTKISLQYTIYDKFNGSSKNYDGSGRNASDNDTLYAALWLAF